MKIHLLNLKKSIKVFGLNSAKRTTKNNEQMKRVTLWVRNDSFDFFNEKLKGKSSSTFSNFVRNAIDEKISVEKNTMTNEVSR